MSGSIEKDIDSLFNEMTLTRQSLIKVGDETKLEMSDYTIIRDNLKKLATAVNNLDNTIERKMWNELEKQIALVNNVISVGRHDAYSGTHLELVRSL